MLFSISWPVPPKHDRQHFLKKEKFSSSYPGVSKFSTNQKPVFYRCFQILGLVLGCKRVQKKAKQGVLCFFRLLCSCSRWVCGLRARWVSCTRAYVFFVCLCLCLRLCLCLCLCLCFFIFGFYSGLIFIFLFWFIFLCYSFCSAPLSRFYSSRSLYVCACCLYSCMSACAREYVRVRAPMFFYCCLFLFCCMYVFYYYLHSVVASVCVLCVRASVHVLVHVCANEVRACCV